MGLKRQAAGSPAALPANNKRLHVMLLPQCPKHKSWFHAFTAILAAQLPLGIHAANTTWRLGRVAHDLSRRLTPLLQVVAREAAWLSECARAAAATELGDTLQQLLSTIDDMGQAQLRMEAGEVAEAATRLMSLARCLADAAADHLSPDHADDAPAGEEEEADGQAGRAWHEPSKWDSSDLRQLPMHLEALLRAVERRACRHFIGGRRAAGGRTGGDLSGAACRLAAVRGMPPLLACAAVTMFLSPCCHAGALQLDPDALADVCVALPGALAALQEVAAGQPEAADHFLHLCSVPAAAAAASGWDTPGGSEWDTVGSRGRDMSSSSESDASGPRAAAGVELVQDDPLDVPQPWHLNGPPTLAPQVIAPAVPGPWGSTSPPKKRFLAAFRAL